MVLALAQILLASVFFNLPVHRHRFDDHVMALRAPVGPPPARFRLILLYCLNSRIYTEPHRPPSATADTLNRPSSTFHLDQGMVQHLESPRLHARNIRHRT